MKVAIWAVAALLAVPAQAQEHMHHSMMDAGTAEPPTSWPESGR